MSSSTTLDPVSFLFGQVLSQVDYLFESGYLSQENYSIIAGALIQTSPPSTPNARPAYPSYASSSQLTSEPSAYSTASYASGSGRPLPPLQTGSVPSATAPHHQQPAASPSTASQSSSKPSLLKFKGKSSKGKTTANEPPLPQAPFAEADEPQLGRVNRRLRGALQGG